VAFCGSKRVQKIPKTVPNQVKKKKTGRKKERKQNRTEQKKTMQQQERGCEGMEALETILGSLVQSKKTQRQDWKTSDGKQRREKTHTQKREQRTRRHSPSKRSWDRILSSAMIE
jgi:hypothetical protein